VSYLIDVYRREIPVAGSYTEFAVYHSLFPQLVAGPIVRYSEIRSEMGLRAIDRAALTEGAYRFCLGLGKKLIIADNLGIVADAIFALPAGELGWQHAWLGILCYSLQIYFDFSGYSDMAIGMGRILGFHFPENFDQPYISASVTEFWRRWHMTLSRWFRDYLYIRRQSAGNAAHLRQSLDRVLSLRPVAGRRSDLHRLGALSRLAADRGTLRPCRPRLAACGTNRDRPDVPAGHHRLGVLSRVDPRGRGPFPGGDVPAWPGTQ
jgi:alginate O-acetyltransferase complex protein AlgI